MGRLMAALIGAFAATGFIMEVEHGMLTQVANDGLMDIKNYSQSAATEISVLSSTTATQLQEFAQTAAIDFNDGLTQFNDYVDKTATDLQEYAQNAATNLQDFNLQEYASNTATNIQEYAQNTATNIQEFAQSAAKDYQEFKESGKPLITITVNKGGVAAPQQQQQQQPETFATATTTTTSAAASIPQPLPPPPPPLAAPEVEEKEQIVTNTRSGRGRGRGRGKPVANNLAALRQGQPVVTQANRRQEAVVPPAPPTQPAAAAAATTTTTPPPPPPARNQMSGRGGGRGGGIVKCDASDRRALAASPSATERNWEDMTRCLVRRDNQEKLGHFFMHISKSGGTSAVNLFEEAGCDQGKIKKKFSAYQNPGKKQLNFKCNWYKGGRTENEGYEIEYFAIMERNRMKPVTCAAMKETMDYFGVPFLSSESIAPYENMGTGVDFAPQNLCTDKYVNSIIVREPIKRIESHWKHMVTICTPKEQCESKFYIDPNSQDIKFNATYMTHTFNILTDNYVARSLAGRGYYEWENAEQPDMSIQKHPEAMSKIYPIANATLHKFDWVMLINSGDAEEGSNLDLVFQYGIGLGKDIQFPHARSGSKTKKSMVDLHWKALRRMNNLDYMLWESAKELNRLDVLSLKRMVPYYQKALDESRRAKAGGVNKEQQQPCCGIVCRSGETKWTPEVRQW